MPTRKLDAVLPLRRRDHARFHLLDRSLRRNLRDLGRCWVVATDEEHAELEHMIPDDIYHVIPESAIIPEIGFYRALHRFLCRSAVLVRCVHGRFDAAGWFVQQLAKLAIAERIETDFYLTLDSDVLCLKPVGHDDLIQGGKALANTREEDIHPDWYAHAERVLGMPRSGITHGVTPAILSREGVLKLQDFLRARASLLVRALRPRATDRVWRGYLLRNTPWTEYTLYYTFLEHEGLFDRYHVPGGVDAIYDNRYSIWNEREFCDARIEAFLGSNAFFLVVQSNTGIEPETVREKVARYLDE